MGGTMIDSYFRFPYYWGNRCSLALCESAASCDSDGILSSKALAIGESFCSVNGLLGFESGPINAIGESYVEPYLTNIFYGVPKIAIGECDAQVISIYDLLLSEPRYDKNFILQFVNVLDELLINHNLEKYPSVSVIDSLGNNVQVLTDYIDINSLMLYWNGTLTGTVILN